MAVLYIEYNQS